MASGKKYGSIEQYLADFPDNIRQRLEAVRKAIRSELPADATESMSYGVPTYKVDGRNIMHFGGFKDHISLFPGPDAVTAFKAELSTFKTSKGTVQFPLDQPLPLDLIRKITRAYHGRSD